MSSEKFAKVLKPLVSSDVIYTQGLSFELRKDVSKGFPWHVGTQSFGFQRKDDFGITIWVPLIPIDAKKTGGGMAYVPKDILSGEFVYQHINGVPDYVEPHLEKKSTEEALEFFLETKNSVLNTGQLYNFLEHYAEQDDFEIGDAFIFDKYVMHRSVPLFGGEHDVRSAFVFRFCGIDSRYDKDRVEKLSFARNNFEYSGSSAFNEKVASVDGAYIRDSQMFDDLGARTVSIS